MKNLKKLGKVLGKKEQMSVNGGKVLYGHNPLDDFQCPIGKVVCFLPQNGGLPSCCDDDGRR